MTKTKTQGVNVMDVTHDLILSYLVLSVLSHFLAYDHMMPYTTVFRRCDMGGNHPVTIPSHVPFKCQTVRARACITGARITVHTVTVLSPSPSFPRSNNHRTCQWMFNK